MSSIAQPASPTKKALPDPANASSSPQAFPSARRAQRIFCAWLSWVEDRPRQPRIRLPCHWLPPRVAAIIGGGRWSTREHTEAAWEANNVVHAQRARDPYRLAFEGRCRPRAMDGRAVAERSPRTRPRASDGEIRLRQSPRYRTGL